MRYFCAAGEPAQKAAPGNLAALRGLPQHTCCITMGALLRARAHSSIDGDKQAQHKQQLPRTGGDWLSTAHHHNAAIPERS